MSKHDEDDADAEHLIAGMVLGAAAAIGVAAIVLRYPRRRVAAFSAPGAVTPRPIQVIEVRSGTDDDDDVPTVGPRWN